MLEVKNLEDINLCKRYIPFDTNKNSRLYYDNNIIYKVPFLIKDSFKDTLEYIDKCNLKELIKLKGLIVDKDKLVGYYFINYKNYKSLRKYKMNSLITKKQTSFKIVSAFDTLNKYNIVYKDFHLGNILYNNDEVKICDLDGTYIKDDYKDKINNLKQSAVLALAYIHNVTYHDISVLLKTDNVINNSELLKRFKELQDYNDALKILSDIDLSVVNIERKKIKKKSKELSNTGYFDFDYV